MLVSPGSLVPPRHPLRGIKTLADDASRALDATLSEMYSDVGRPSVPPERALKTLLLRVLYSIRSERQVCEQLRYNTVDGVLIGALASHRSFEPKDEDPGDSDGWSDFKGDTRKDDTHESKTDPDARLMRKSGGVGADLSYAVDALMEHKNGLLVDVRADIATGTAERDAAVEMLDESLPGTRRISLGADKRYGTDSFVEKLREMNVTPHIAQNTHGGRRRSNVDGRTTRHKGYNMSLIRRRLIEQVFGWMKQPGRMKRARYPYPFFSSPLGVDCCTRELCTPVRQQSESRPGSMDGGPGRAFWGMEAS